MYPRRLKSDFLSVAQAPQQKPNDMNTPHEAQIEAWLQQLTLEQKAALYTGMGMRLPGISQTEQPEKAPKENTKQAGCNNEDKKRETWPCGFLEAQGNLPQSGMPPGPCP